VVLAGCGVYDGSEVQEAVAVLLNLSRAGAEVACFAPDVEQMHVIDHTKGQPAQGESRNVLTESARIARGEISPIDRLMADDFDAVVFPGGFGAAKNLCDFATKGADCTVHPEVERVVKMFHSKGKVIGMCCIAPVIAARVLGSNAGGPGCSVTIGNDADTASAIEAMGSTNVDKPVTEAHTDEANRLVTAPAYMYGDAKVHEVEAGIAKMVDRVLEMAGAGAAA
jgi:enhancing lycopene biosynthesis protein 2